MKRILAGLAVIGCVFLFIWGFVSVVLFIKNNDYLLLPIAIVFTLWFAYTIGEAFVD